MALEKRQVNTFSSFLSGPQGVLTLDEAEYALAVYLKLRRGFKWDGAKHQARAMRILYEKSQQKE